MMNRTLKLSALLPVLLMAVPLAGSAQLRPSRLIGDGMVMQRDAAVPVWGWAAPGAAVTVVFDGVRHETRADASGAWRVELPPMPAGGPHRLEIESGAERVVAGDVMVGDVWIASGQSNMEWTVADSRDAEREIAAATDRAIRHFKVPQSWAEAPEATLAGGEWQVADPSTAGSFSAVAYFFARDLREHLDVPIGIINTTWGGSRIEPWMSRAALGYDDAGWAAVQRAERDARERMLEALRARIGALPDTDGGLVEGRAVWADPALDDAGWAAIPVPGAWEAAGYPGMDGVAWYRTSFDLTPVEARAGVRLGLGMIDDSDVSWVNGYEVGRTDNAWNAQREYEVPPSALRPGRNVVAVRVEDFQGGGGIHGDPALLFVETAAGRRPLAGDWRFRVGSVSVNLEGQKNQVPTLLYNRMVHPLLPYPIRGVIWYQGESNANSREDAVAYRERFAELITSWRDEWGQGDFPFLWVQLAGYMDPAAEPGESNWALLRESQTAALALPATGQALALDLGEADDIHPRNKQDVGRRLALAARRVAYGHDVVHSGPVYSSHRLRDGRVVVELDHVGGGLEARGPGDEVRGFAIAGADRRWVWADARIEGDRVVVWSDRVPEPVAVRYAWGDNPVRANLYNREGLPATPFRTDRW